MRCICKGVGVGLSKSDIIYWVGSSESDKIGDGLVGRSKMTQKIGYHMWTAPNGCSGCHRGVWCFRI